MTVDELIQVYIDHGFHGGEEAVGPRAPETIEVTAEQRATCGDYLQASESYRAAARFWAIAYDLLRADGEGAPFVRDLDLGEARRLRPELIDRARRYYENGWAWTKAGLGVDTAPEGDARG